MPNAAADKQARPPLRDASSDEDLSTPPTGEGAYRAYPSGQNLSKLPRACAAPIGLRA